MSDHLLYKHDDTDLVSGFKRLPENVIEKRPPKIRWGRIYKGEVYDPYKSTSSIVVPKHFVTCSTQKRHQESAVVNKYFWTDADRLNYAEQLASTMNHAADLMQQERNTLNELIKQKEQLVIQSSRQLSENNNMLQQEVTRMNQYKKDMQLHAKKLNQEIKELKKQVA
jgi:hypothetical protein